MLVEPRVVASTPVTILGLVMLGALAASCGDEPPVQTAPPAYSTDVPTRYPAAERVVALGDVHGDLEALRTALWLGDLVDEDDHWIGGETVVVQTGDLLDRGDDEQAIVDLLERLREEAAAAGGAVHVLHGNHELMNVALDFRYVTDAGFVDFEDAPGVDVDDPRVVDFDPRERARASAFMPGGSYAKRLADHPVVVVVGDTVYAHGGVLPGYAAEVERINREVSAWLLGLDDAGMLVVDDDDSPVWSRHYSDAPSATDCSKLRKALDVLRATRMVVGHSVHDQIVSYCDEQVWAVDVGMSAYYGGTPEVLELTGDGDVYTIALSP